MDAIGNEKNSARAKFATFRKETRKIIEPTILFQQFKKDSKNNAKKNQSSNQGSSLSNSEKKNHDLYDKLGKDRKLTQAERTRQFHNNLCLLCGGVGHTAKECPKSSSSATKAKARAVQTKSDSAPIAEDTKKLKQPFGLRMGEG